MVKRKLKFRDYKKCLKAAQIDRKINYLEKNKFDVGSFKEDRKEFVKNKKITLKTQQKFISERHVITEEINKIALISNDDKKCNQFIQQKHMHME